jgi:1-acyl-sn-glycerol-3-phosphate acyltransferase
MPIYRLPASPLASLLWSWLTLRPRSFADDAQRAVAGLTQAPTVLGAEHVPRQGPCLVTCNHYTRPGLAAWWLTFGVTAAVAAHRAPAADPQIHWVMTAAWTFPGSRWRRRVLTPATYWAFARVARIYGFVPMPPMPPDPGQAEARAMAVLRTVRLGRRLVQEGGMLGLAPEGRDVPGGLGQPPSGVGEFITLLEEMGFPVLPVGVSEAGGRLQISFGAPFWPEIPPERSERDAAVAGQVMAAIAEQLPVEGGRG